MQFVSPIYRHPQRVSQQARETCVTFQVLYIVGVTTLQTGGVQQRSTNQQQYSGTANHMY